MNKILQIGLLATALCASGVGCEFDDKATICCVANRVLDDGRLICRMETIDPDGKGCVAIGGCTDGWSDYAFDEDGNVIEQICTPTDAVTREDEKIPPDEEPQPEEKTTVIYVPVPIPGDEPTANPPPAPTAPHLRVSYQIEGHVPEDLKLRNCFDAGDIYFEQKQTTGFNVDIAWTECIQIDIGTGRWACNAYHNRQWITGTLHIYLIEDGQEQELLIVAKDTDSGPGEIGNCPIP